LLSSLFKFTHVPLQFVFDSEQPHVPPVQTSPVAQT
jgi:hypothetical protein